MIPIGLYLRRVLLQCRMLGWQGSTRIHGSFQSESAATFDRNRWHGSTRISGNLRPEYALGDDFIEDFRGAILDGADNAEQHPTGHTAPTPIVPPRLTFE